MAPDQGHLAKNRPEESTLCEKVPLEKRQCSRNCARVGARCQIVSLALDIVPDSVSPKRIHATPCQRGFLPSIPRLVKPASGPKWLAARKMGRRRRPAGTIRGMRPIPRMVKKREFRFSNLYADLAHLAAEPPSLRPPALASLDLAQPWAPETSSAVHNLQSPRSRGIECRRPGRRLLTSDRARLPEASAAGGRRSGE